MKGWLLFGGDDSVQEIQDFRAVAKARGEDIVELDPSKLHIAVGLDKTKAVSYENKWLELPDYVYPAFAGDPPYHSKAILRHLASLGVFCVNEWEAIEAASDKLHSLQLLVENKVTVPETLLVEFPLHDKLLEFVEKRFGFPIVLKTLAGSQGIGVFFPDTKARLQQMLELVDCTDSSSYMLVQKNISESKGRDLRVFVLDGEAIACIERKSNDPNEPRANKSLGGAATAYELTNEIKSLSENVVSIFELNVAGIDLLFGDDGFYVCEVTENSGKVRLATNTEMRL